MNDHRTLVKEIQKKILSSEKPLRFTTQNTSNSLRARSKKGIDTSKLNRILSIQPQWAHIEPRVTFQHLCNQTLKIGLIPPVVPEFATITVGGAIMGAALESSSHRFGQVSDICLEYEILLGNGECVKASPDQNPDLFYGLSGSYGTLGLLTSVKIRLIAAKKYVHINYQMLKTKELLSSLTSSHQAEFVEGIVLDQEKGLLITGNMTSKASQPLNRQNHYWSPWYIQNIEHKQEEWMPIQEYLFRLDRGAFWMGRYVLSIKAMLQLLLHIGIPKLDKKRLCPNLLFRILFGWSLSSKRLYNIWHNIPTSISENLFFVHDFYTPKDRVETIFSSFTAQTNIYPIWLCPIRGTQTPQILSPHYGNTDLLNIGLYGIPDNPLSIPHLTAKLEKEIGEAGGRKMLYSYTYYDKKSFSSIYPEAAYLALRKKFFAEKAFPRIYDKILYMEEAIKETF